MVERLDVGGCEVAYERVGTGVPLVLLHGWLRSRQEWQSLRPHLHAPLLVPDLPGFGESDIVSGNYDIPFFVRKIMGLIDGLGIRDFIPVGHGLGGAIAVQIGHEQPERVKGMVLLSSASWPNPRLDRRAGVVRGPFGSFYFRYVFDQDRCRQLLVRRHYADPSRVDDAVLDAVYSPLCRPNARTALHRSLAAAFNPRISLQLETVLAPTLAIWGQNDQVHPIEMGERLAKEKPNTRLVVIPGGDYMVMESEAPTVGRHIMDWLRDLPGSGAAR